MHVEPAWKTYLKVGLALLPTFFFWVFSLIIIFPKIESICDKAGLGPDDKAPTAVLSFIIGLSRFAFLNFYVIISGIVVMIALLEIWVGPWPGMRRPICFTGAVLLNTLVLLALTATAVVASLAAAELQRGTSP